MSPDEQQSARRVGATLKDKWVLEELLGVGGMASVYVARHKIGRRDAIKMLDSGIARVRAADKRALTPKAGITLGTMAYMAPEQARGEEIDGRADVYAVGATVFRAIAGRFVHDADTQAALVMRVIAHGA